LTGEHAFRLEGNATLNANVDISSGSKIFIDGQGSTVTTTRYPIRVRISVVHHLINAFDLRSNLLQLGRFQFKVSGSLCLYNIKFKDGQVCLACSLAGSQA
jgi:hypothetical protein